MKPCHVLYSVDIRRRSCYALECMSCHKKGGGNIFGFPGIQCGGHQRLFNEAQVHPSVALELPEGTLLERTYNETLAKLNFVLALSDLMMELAQGRAMPLTTLTESGNGRQQTEGCRRGEQLMLLVRALQLLSSGLGLVSQQLTSRSTTTFSFC